MTFKVQIEKPEGPKKVKNIISFISSPHNYVFKLSNMAWPFSVKKSGELLHFISYIHFRIKSFKLLKMMIKMPILRTKQPKMTKMEKAAKLAKIPKMAKTLPLWPSHLLT